MITAELKRCESPNKARRKYPVTWERGRYDELFVAANPKSRARVAAAWRDVKRLIKELDRGQSDEHGAWETGAAFDKKGRGEAVNVDVYGVDIVDGQTLGVVQVRQYRKYYKDGWGNVRKNYFLVGRNENRQPFAHPVPAQVVRRAISRDPSPMSAVTASRAWIFGVKADQLRTILRHGDVAAVHVKRLPPGAVTVLSDRLTSVQVIDAHVLTAEEVVRVGEHTYARNFALTHLKHQHPDVEGEGWHRIQIGYRARFWEFARPTED